MSVTAINDASVESLFSARGRAVPAAAISDPRSAAALISFIYGFPDTETLPNATVLESTARALDEYADWALQYGKTTGVPALVDVLRSKLARDQRIVATPEEVMITAGGSQALQLVLDLLVDPGDTVIAEGPTWMGFVDALNNVGGRLETVPIDGDGIDTDALEVLLKRLRGTGVRPKLIYVMTNFQNPTGVSMSLARRERVAAIAEEYGVFVLEDDAYHDLRFSGAELPTIYSLDRSGMVLYLGTLSKIMGPGMRIGWLVAAEPIIQRLAQLKFDGGTNIFGSHVAAEWIPAHLDAHIDLLREMYGRRCDLMCRTLSESMPEGTTWSRPEGGFFLWVTLPESIDAGQLLPQARERGIEFLPGQWCYTDGRGRNQIRLAFSFARDEQIGPGIRILGEIVCAELREQGR